MRNRSREAGHHRTCKPLMLVLIASLTTASWLAGAQSGGTTKAVSQLSTYVCPMHPDAQSKTPGSCAKCGMRLVNAQDRSGFGTYPVELSTIPDHPRAGAPTTLQFRISDPHTGKLVQHFDTVHEKIFHLFVISDNLAHFQHIHPVRRPDGTFIVETVLPASGGYQIICDFSPAGGWPQVVRKNVAATGQVSAERAVTVSDGGRSRIVEGTRVDLDFDVPHPAAGVPVELNLHVTEARTGLPVGDLQPYLGAWAHSVVLSGDTRDFVHLHPSGTQPAPRDDGKPVVGGPKVSFTVSFPRPGPYRVWSQLQRDGKVMTVSYDVNVLPPDPIALWNRKGWSAATPIAVGNRIVHAIAATGSQLYAAVDATDVAGPGNLTAVMKWDGHAWSAVGALFNGNVWAMAAIGPDIYAAGDFTASGATAVSGIARWDGYAWRTLDDGVSGCNGPGCTPAVYALASAGKELYVGGRFVSAGRMVCNGIARWDGERWSATGEGVHTGTYDGVVRALATDGKFVYATGTFRGAGRTNANNIAKWDGKAWSALGEGLGGGLERGLAIGLADGKVYVGGDFTMAGSAEVSNAAVWDGAKWSSLNIRTNGEITTIAAHGGDIYFGGSLFTLPSGQNVPGVVRWNGQWSDIGRNLMSTSGSVNVRVLTAANDKILAAGRPFVLIPAGEGNREGIRMPKPASESCGANCATR